MDYWIDIVYILLLIIALTPFLMYGYRAARSFRRKERYRNILDKIDAAYEGVDTYAASKTYRMDSPQYDLLYGEVTIPVLLDMMDRLNPPENALFYDLGSGGGKAALAVKLSLPRLRVIGIEIVEHLNTLANQCLERCREMNPMDNLQQIEFITANFLEYDFKNGDVFFINATGFSNENWQRIVTKLNDIKRGSMIITTSKQLPALQFLRRSAALELMQWGFTSTYIYERM